MVTAKTDQPPRCRLLFLILASYLVFASCDGEAPIEAPPVSRTNPEVPINLPEPPRKELDPRDRLHELIDELQSHIGIDRHTKLMGEVSGLTYQHPKLATDVFLERHGESPYLADNLLDSLSLSEDPAVLPALLTSLDSKTAFVRIKATQLLTSRPRTEATAPLIRNLSSKADQLKEQLSILEALRYLPGDETSLAVQQFLNRTTDDSVRLRALSVLGDARSVSAEKTLRDHLKSTTSAHRVEALRGLLKLGFDDVLPLVPQCLSSDDPDTILQTLQVVQQLGLVDFLEELKLLAVHQEPNVRLYTVAVLAVLNHPDINKILAERSEDENQLVRRAALVSRAERDDPEALESLRMMASKEGPDARWALMVLSRLKDPEEIEKGIARLRVSTDLKERRTLIRALVRSRDQSAVHPLLDQVVDLYHTDDPLAREMARETARYLANFREAVIDPLLARYRKESDPEIRHLLLSGLNFVGSKKGLLAVENLLKETKDPALLSTLDELKEILGKRITPEKG